MGVRHIIVKIYRDLYTQLSRIPNATKIGILAVILVYISVAGMVSFATPWWLGRGDAPRHIDYIWRVYGGDLPKYEDGLKYPPFAKLGQGVYKKQEASAHPPLFYVIHAPIVGPVLESGEWQKAVALGRSLNMLIGIMCILALAWGGWLLGGRRKELFAVATPALASTMHHFTSLNLNYANDVLLILISTLALITIYKLLLHGLKLKYLIGLTLLSVGGMATKAPYIVFLFTSMMAIFITAIIHGNKSRRRNLIKGVMISLLLLAVVLISIGWFYYLQNYRTTGKWFSSIPDYWGRSARRYKSFVDVITGHGLWSLWYKSYSSIASVSIAMSISALAGIGWIFYKRNLKFNNRPLVILVVLMLITTLGIFATQIQHAVGFGGYYFRYLLPVTLPLSLFLAYGLLEFRWTRGVLVFIFSIGMAASTMITIPRMSALTAKMPEVRKTQGTLAKIHRAAATNNVPQPVMASILALFPVGSALLFWSLFLISKRSHTSVLSKQEEGRSLRS